MVVVIADQGRNNRIQIDPDVLASGTGIINTVGDDNEVVIGKECSLIDCDIKLVRNSTFHAGDEVRLAKLNVFAAEDAHVRIGAQTWFTYHTRIFLHEPATVTIGKNCLIASNTLLMVSDMHSICDLDTGQRINFAQDILIHDKVWLAEEVAVMKGVTIGAGAAIGFRSVVTTNIPAYALAAGIPARIIRERIVWSSL